jgi:hypothetical protein
MPIACSCGAYGLYEEPVVIDGKLKLKVKCLYCEYEEIKEPENEN